MAKINFTKDHYEKMCALLMTMLINGDTITTKFGTPLDVVELLHTTTIGTLNSIRLSLAKQIENLENQDEWVSSEANQNRLSQLKAQKELVNLVIGYKRFQMEIAETAKKKSELQEKIAKMKEEAKTPEDRLKEAEAELAAFEDENF